MKPRHAVVAFPALVRADSVEAVRRRFDPLASVLDAHVTLVFPFDSDISEASLADHVGQAVEGVRPFSLALTGLTVEAGEYLFLNVGSGAKRFLNLHARLYSGPLAGHRSSTHEYRPHVTVGRSTDHHTLAEAQQEAHLALGLPVLGTVSGLAIFRLDGPDRGGVVCRVPFGA
jgi:2'-5' RNA ligase